MKALNSSRNVTLKYPRDTPRISRKRLWYDRSEWRQNPNTTYDGSTGLIDNAMEQARNPPELSQTPYQHMSGVVNSAGRTGLKKI